ncbi:carbohydrate-binding family 9-like protein [Lutibacter citreus]|uniref:carbohydrate-binding family 9-like protein n=1 Tax=Lutibacter citreus TaxID=2138210 RepID=UPI000DBE82BE|nr:carbohydrate-binding family 9-like protein [Lutibacter citreus]
MVSIKKSYNLIIVCLFMAVLASSISCKQEYKLSLEDRPIFKVHKSSSEIIADGKMNEKDWDKSEARSFEYTYNDEKTDDVQKTKFRMLWDDEHIYLFYECEDKFITARETERDGMPFYDDCAEIFLTPAPESSNAHICFEVNLNKAVNDLVFVSDFNQGNGLAVKGYNPNNVKIGVQINGTVNDNSDIDKGWTMEFVIPKEAFLGADRHYPIEAGNQWAFLALRQGRNEVEGQRRVTSTIFPVENIKEKDVHQPNMFGLMEFIE